MAEIEVFRMRTEHMEKDKFAAIAEHLGVRGDLVATEEALFVQDKQRALAFAMPGSRFAGLLFFTDQSQAMAASIEKAPSNELIEAWTREFLERFRLGLRESVQEQVRVSFALRAHTTESAVERGTEISHVPVKTDVVSELRVNDYHVTGPRANLRLVFKSGKSPIWIHRALWDKLEVFETRTMLSEDEAYRRISEQLSRRGQMRRTWRMINVRLAYFAGEFGGGPDLLLPYYFADIELHDPKDRQQVRQGPRQLIQIPACR